LADVRAASARADPRWTLICALTSKIFKSNNVEYGRSTRFDNEQHAYKSDIFFCTDRRARADPADTVEFDKLLDEFRLGNAQASGRLIALVYEDLRRLARAPMHSI
jgi:hypothetical protein